MTRTNVGERLGHLVDEAQSYGRSRMTEPAIEVWLPVLGLVEPTSRQLHLGLAALHRNVEELRSQLKIANPALLSECRNEIDSLNEALGMNRLADPWNNTRLLLGDRTRMSLRACAAALDGRFDEERLQPNQLSVADRILADCLQGISALDLPQYVSAFLEAGVKDLRLALKWADKLGPHEFAAAADRLLGSLGRALAQPTSEQSIARTIVRKVGVAVASISAAATMGLGVIALDQQTVNLLPWGDQIDPVVVRCVVEGRETAAIAQQRSAPEEGESAAIQP